MSIKKNLIKNTGFNLAGYFYLLLASFFSVSILLNNLGSNVFGVYIFFMSVISFASVFDFGISSAVVRRLALPNTTPDERTRTWKTSFAIFTALAAIVSLFVFLILHRITGTMPIFVHVSKNTLNLSILFISIIAFFNHLNSHFLSLPQAEQRFDIFNSKTFIVGTANTVVSAFLSGIYQDISIIYFVQMIFHIITTIFMVAYAMKHFPGRSFAPQYNRKTGKELFSFGLRNFVGTLAGQAENQFSNFILGAMVSAKAITSFSIPQSIVIKGAGIVSQVAQAFFPLSASLLEKDRIHKLKKLVLGIELVTLSGGFLAVLLIYTIGYPFLLLWLKDQTVVDAAYPILKILGFYFVLVALTPIPTALLQGLNKPQIPSFFGFLTVFLEIIFSLLFISNGAIGVAYAYLVSVCITVPAILVVTWKQLNREIIRISVPQPEPQTDTQII